MTAPPAHDHPLVRDYLDRLAAAGAALPPWRRDELSRDIAAHVDDAVASRGDDDPDLAVRDALDRLGPPEAVVVAEGVPAWPVPTAPAPRSAWGPLEVVAVVLLVAGSFVLPVVGPLVGLALAWASSRWTPREKGVATGVAVAPLVLLVLVVVLVPLIRTVVS